MFWWKIWLVATEWCECIRMLFMYVYVSDDWWQGLGKNFFIFKGTILLPVEVTRRMLILLNYCLKLLERQWYTVDVTSLAHIYALSLDNVLPNSSLFPTQREKSCFPSMTVATIFKHDTFAPMAREFTLSQRWNSHAKRSPRCCSLGMSCMNRGEERLAWISYLRARPYFKQLTKGFR